MKDNGGPVGRRYSVNIRQIDGSGKEYWVSADSQDRAEERALKLHMKCKPLDFLDRFVIQAAVPHGKEVVFSASKIEMFSFEIDARGRRIRRCSHTETECF